MIINIFQSKVSIWSKTSNTKVENTGTYILERKSKLNVFHKSLYISHKESLDVPVSIILSRNHKKIFNYSFETLCNKYYLQRFTDGFEFGDGRQFWWWQCRDVHQDESVEVHT